MWGLYYQRPGQSDYVIVAAFDDKKTALSKLYYLGNNFMVASTMSEGISEENEGEIIKHADLSLSDISGAISFYRDIGNIYVVNQHSNGYMDVELFFDLTRAIEKAKLFSEEDPQSLYGVFKIPYVPYENFIENVPLLDKTTIDYLFVKGPGVETKGIRTTISFKKEVIERFKVLGFVVPEILSTKVDKLPYITEVNFPEEIRKIIVIRNQAI